MRVVNGAPSRAPWARATALVAGLLLGGTLTGCLAVTNPDVIPPGAVRNATGAEALRTGALAQLMIATGGDDANNDDTWFGLSDLLSDEWASASTFAEHNQIDSRNILVSNVLLDASFRNLQRPRVTAEEAIASLRKFSPSAPPQEIGQMFNIQAFVENLMAETMCNGVPLSEVTTAPDGSSQLVFGGPVTTDSMYRRALAHYDSAIVDTAGGDPRIFFGARVGLARVLLNMGRYVDAETTATVVPTSFQWLVSFSSVTGPDNANWDFNFNQFRYSVGDTDGHNGLNFVSAGDPRVPTVDQGPGFDSQTEMFTDTLWHQFITPVVLADGIEARLIEAEGELFQGHTANWLNILNALRAGTGLPSADLRFKGLTPLVDPGSASARQDLHFSERAFWLFATGHRLGDLRRLVRQYGRGTETVFPTGAYRKGGTYGPDVNFPIPLSELNNPKFSGQCIDRNA